MKRSGAASFMFLSRLVPVKNIHFFLERLVDNRSGKVILSIVGPLEDQDYWAQCQKIIESIPQNVEIRTLGAVSYADGLKLLCQHHFLVLPTLSENFGYVMLEGLAAGSPILISDRTMWGDVQRAGAGWVTPLGDPAAWSALIDRCIGMDGADYSKMSSAARSFAESYLANDEKERATADLLEHAFGRLELRVNEKV
jgi:glycosyltransferase involved in cell wall biosynthesis